MSQVVLQQPLHLHLQIQIKPHKFIITNIYIMEPKEIVQYLIDDFILICNMIDKNLSYCSDEEGEILMKNYKNLQNRMVDLLDDMDKFIDNYDNTKEFDNISNNSIEYNEN